MTLRWLHRSWVYFWNSIGILLLVVIIFSGISYGVLQLPVSKSYIAHSIEDTFNKDRDAVLEIGTLTGHIPFSFSISDISIYSDSSRSDLILRIDSTNASINLRGWFSNQLIVPLFEINRPELTLNLEEDYSTLFSRKRSNSDSAFQIADQDQDKGKLEFLFPVIRIQDGTISLNNLNIEDSLLLDTKTLTLSDLSMQSFFEYGSSQRFVDIEQFSFGMPEANIDRINLFGQIFNDDRYLEFNAFNVSTKHNALRFSAEFDGINLLEDNLIGQLNASSFDISVTELITQPNNLRKIIVGLPDIEQQIYSRIEAKGTTDSVIIDDMYLLVGNSELQAYGSFQPSSDYKSESFRLNVESLNFDTSDVKSWVPSLTDIQNEVISNTEIEGNIQGNLDNVFTNFQLYGDRGTTTINTNIDRRDTLIVNTSMLLDQVDLGNLIYSSIASTNLNGILHFKTNSFESDSAEGQLEIHLTTGSLNAFAFDSLSLTTDWLKGDFTPSFLLTSDDAFFTGDGDISFADSIKSIELIGEASNLDLKSLTNSERLSNSLIDMNYELNLNGTDLSNSFGLITVDLPNTVVEGDTLDIHQIYADFSSSAETGKSFRLTSTPIDFSVSGNFELTNIFTLSDFWVEHITKKINEEILFKEAYAVSPELNDTTNSNLQLNFDIKDLPLIRAYYPHIPNINSTLSGNSNININNESILFNLALFDSSFSYNSYVADSLNFQVTGSFRKDEPISSFSSLQILSSASTFSSELVEAGTTQFSLQLNDDSVYVQSVIQSIAGENDFYLNGNIQIADSTLNMRVDSLSLGNSLYQWQSTGIPALTYYADDRLEFQNFEFKNEQESLNFEGVFSDQASDSVNYNVNNVDLARISDLLNGRINFSGVLDANFTTKSLTRIPSIQGDLGIDAFSIDERVIGDVDVSSLFNSERNRFDTRVTVSTDSAKYPDYFTRTDRRGQNITFEGFVLSPDNAQFTSSDSLFYFDLDFESIDLWILPFIAPRVFTEMSGIASGGGSIWGNLEDFDFNVNYDIGTDDAIFFRPRFLDTYYFGLGNITLNRQDGLIFNDLFIIDPSGGSANLNGTYDLGHLGNIHEMDLTLEMDEFQFLNNDFDPDVPFFGDAYGSTVLRMTGTNLNPILTTDSPILISDFSKIGLPLLEETEFDEDNKFIRFVDTFEFETTSATGVNTVNQNLTNDEEVNPFDRTFVERFTLDLQFVAQNPMEVQLIFDPITGDQIDVEGIGRLGIRLEDEQLSMFGQFDINGGTYQFVSGEIFTRRFDIEPGGTIIWEGEPGNARLNLNAIYAARPDINTLSQNRADIDSESSQRVPVELVLNVGGSISTIENNFFFRLPNNFETRQNSTLNTQIAALNRNEDEKLIQAASFLLMGDFIPSATATSDATESFTTNFSGSSAVLNPLLSSQIISPLLSNQINSLLRSDIGSLDIDFNLNTYNNVDLGVALRLYNDRIILSREGQITGSQSNIGDIGATYRINNTLSVTAFHRQDPTFSNISGGEESQQAQDINGVGFEAEVSFNSWQEFFRRLTSPFRKIFGKKEDNTEIATSE